MPRNASLDSPPSSEGPSKLPFPRWRPTTIEPNVTPAWIWSDPAEAQAAAALVPALGDWLGQPRYDLLDSIASGGMGEVFLAYDRELEREVALKVLHREHTSNALMCARFVQEARAISQLEHPNIVPVYDIGETADGRQFFTMKLVRGQTLEALIDDLRHNRNQAQERFPFARRLQIVLQAAHALKFAHNRGVLHRDIKPANLMIGPYGEVLVMDWGLARRSRRLGISGPLPNLSLAGCTCGTPDYIAPEAVEDSSRATEQCDIYSLGVVMYELFALHPPFADKQGMAAIIMSMTEDPEPADQYALPVQGRVPKEISRVIQAAMVRRPGGRFRTMSDMIDAILRYEQGQAPVVCLQTGLKRGLNWLSRCVDNRAHAMILLLAGAWIAPLVFLLTFLLLR